MVKYVGIYRNFMKKFCRNLKPWKHFGDTVNKMCIILKKLKKFQRYLAEIWNDWKIYEILATIAEISGDIYGNFENSFTKN